MESTKMNITIETIVDRPVEIVWKTFTAARDVTQWNAASDDWHSPSAENDLQVGGKFNYRMEAKDGSFGFDFWGIYDVIAPHEKIAYTLGDNRKVEILFIPLDGKTQIVETFETEDVNPAEMQRNGWQAILNNFKKYTESTTTTL